MLDFTKEELMLLTQDGYKPGFMMDIREGDLIAIPPVWRSQFDGTPIPIKSLTIERILELVTQDYDEVNDRVIHHTVVVFIGRDLDGLPEHCSYGNTYPVLIKRQEG